MRFLSVLTLASVALADVTSILAALTVIQKNTVKLGNDVKGWNGGLLGTVPIIGDSLHLLDSINDGTRTAKASKPLSQDDTFDIANSVVALEKNINTTLTIIINAKPKFAKLLLGPVISLNLNLDKKATDEFGAAITEKVPEDLRTVSSQLIGEIDVMFDKAINAYKGVL